MSSEFSVIWSKVEYGILGESWKHYVMFHARVSSQPAEGVKPQNYGCLKFIKDTKKYGNFYFFNE